MYIYTNKNHTKLTTNYNTTRPITVHEPNKILGLVTADRCARGRGRGASRA